MEKLFQSLYIAAALLHASNPRNAEKETYYADNCYGMILFKRGKIKKKKKVVFSLTLTALEEAHWHGLELVF